MRRKAKIIVYVGIFVLVFLASALTRIFLLGSAPERLVKSLGQDLTCTVFSDQHYENENGNRYDLYIPAGLDRMQDQNLILYIHGGSFNSGSKADGETWCRYYLMGAYILHNVPYDYIEFPKSNHGMYNDPDKLQEFLEKSLEYAERYFTD